MSYNVVYTFKKSLNQASLRVDGGGENWRVRNGRWNEIWNGWSDSAVQSFLRSSLSMARLSHRLDFCSMFEFIPPVIVPVFPSRVPSRAITERRGRNSMSSQNKSNTSNHDFDISKAYARQMGFAGTTILPLATIFFQKTRGFCPR